MKTLQHPIALNLPKVVALLIVYGRHVVQMMTDNAWFPDPDPVLTTVTKHLDQLEAAEARARSRGQGLAAARDIVRKVVVDDLGGLRWYVTKIVSENQGKAAAIIESAGMSRKRYTKYNKPEIRAFMGPIPGEARVQAKAVRKGVAYEWQYSTDGGQTWLALAITTVAHTRLPGALLGSTYLFRFRTTRNSTATDWSSTASLTVR